MQIHFFAAARAASGVAETQVSLTDLAEPTLRALVEKLGGQVMHQCSFLIDGTRSELDTVLTENVRVDVLPPFAGG